MNGWFFGCSFTTGYGLNFDEWFQKDNTNFKGEYDDIKDIMWNYDFLNKFDSYRFNYNDSVWSKLFCEEYDLIHNNLAESGAGNERILHTVISKLPNIRKGDYVFLGASEPCRILLPSGMNEPKLVSTLIFLNSVDRKINEGGLSFNFFNESDKTLIIDFLYNVVHQHPESYDQYYMKVFLDLQKYFQSIDVTCVVWDWNLWFDFETIRTWSSGNINDGHWSPNGHKEFFKLLKQNIKNNNFNIKSKNKNLISPFKKKSII